MLYRRRGSERVLTDINSISVTVYIKEKDVLVVVRRSGDQDVRRPNQPGGRRG